MALQWSRSAVVDLDKETDDCRIKFYREASFQRLPNNSALSGKSAGIPMAPVLPKLVKVFQDFSASFFLSQPKVIATTAPVVETKTHGFGSPSGGLRLSVIEVAGGNGANAKLVADAFRSSGLLKSYRCTDLLEHRPSFFHVEAGLPSEVAVEKYGADCNTLLIIAPPPLCYVDFYAIRAWERVHAATELPVFLIYVGELGASDGGEGMYAYLLAKDYPFGKADQRRWDLLSRHTVRRGVDFFGGEIVRECFVFRLQPKPLPVVPHWYLWHLKEWALQWPS